MKLEEKCLQLGAVVVAAAIALRLLGGGLGQQLLTKLSSPEMAALLLYVETGRVIHPGQAQTPTAPTEPAIAPETEPPETTDAPALPSEPDMPAFAPQDAALVEVNSLCGYDADVETLLQMPLDWNLTGDAPTVLILHSHATESYTKTEDYAESTAYRTLDEGYNMVSVGDRLTQLLEERGIRVIHDRTLHDYPSYTNSYNQARSATRKLLEENPSIRLVLDLHRDSIADSAGDQLSYTVDTQEGSAAQVMMVVGTDAGGLTHPNWDENMALAVKLHALLEQSCPGICRPISFRSQRFNQDLSTGALLIEVGAAGNTRPEALLATEYLADCIAALANGTGG